MEALIDYPIQQPLVNEIFNYKPVKKETKKIKTNNDSTENISKTYVSESEYWDKYYELSDVIYEWNNGILEEKPMSDFESFQMYLWFLGILTEYLKTNSEGNLVGLEIGFKMRLIDRTTIRKPDLALIHENNPVQMKPRDATYKGCFDICFEFLSDSNRKAIERDTVVKKLEYEQSGIREYYILDRKGIETAFYRIDKNGFYRKIRPSKKNIIKSKVLSRFQFRLNDLYDRPSDEKLIYDNVYKHYYKTNLRQKIENEQYTAVIEKQRAEKEKQRAENEKKRADKANKIAAKEKNKAEKAIKELEAIKKKMKLIENVKGN